MNAVLCDCPYKNLQINQMKSLEPQLTRGANFKVIGYSKVISGPGTEINELLIIKIRRKKGA